MDDEGTKNKNFREKLENLIEQPNDILNIIHIIKQEQDI